MNDNITESEFQDIIHRRSNGMISFSEFLEELFQHGINEYQIEVASGQATYKGAVLEFTTDSQVSLSISNEFNRNKALEAISNIAIPFKDFLKGMAKAGIVSYRVDIPEKKVIYYGNGKEELEEQLQR